MSQLTEIAAIAGATTADVVRVAARGGITASDWAIAHAIEKVTTRRAADIMWADGARVAAPSTPAPTNPNAEHDPQVRIYEEPTAPDAPNTVLPDHPRDEEPEPDEGSEAEAFVAPLHSTLIRYSRSRAFADKALRIVAAAPGLDAARRALYRVLTEDRRTSLFGLHPEPEPESVVFAA